MAGWNTYFLIKLMTIWNYLNDVYSSTKNKCQSIYYYLKDYFYGHHDMWLFVPGHTLPVSLSNLNNMVNINWLYNNYDNTITLSKNITDNDIQCKFSWLSAKIQVTDHFNPEEKNEYVIDDFIEKFTLCTNSNTTPSLYIVFMCWCAHTKYWFKTDDDIEFHIIDDMGEEHRLNIHNNKNSVIIKRNRLYVVNQTEDENLTDTNNTIVNPTTEDTPLKGEQNKKDE